MVFQVGQRIFILSKFLAPEGKWTEAKVTGVESGAGLWIENESFAKRFSEVIGDQDFPVSEVNPQRVVKVGPYFFLPFHAMEFVIHADVHVYETEHVGG